MNPILNWVDNNFSIEIKRSSLIISQVPAGAQVIDGQHRLEGLKQAYEVNPEICKLQIVILLAQHLTTLEAARIFLNINTEQKPVPNSLVYDLFGEVKEKNYYIVRALILLINCMRNQNHHIINALKCQGHLRGSRVDLSTVINAIDIIQVWKGNKINMTPENKLGIIDSTELARTEEKMSKKKALELFESGYLDNLEAGTYKTLAEIHKYLFGEIYEFAGKLRNVNIAKNNFRFAPIIYLQAALENIDKMPQSTFDEIVEKYVEMNVAHPFREGNGRSTRIWLDLILKKEIGQVIDWSKVDKDDYLLAMERSPIRAIEIKHLLKQALTEKISDREVYMKGIDYSYYYEGYAVYKMEEL